MSKQRITGQSHSLPSLVYADSQGRIYDHPVLTMAAMSGPQAVLPEAIELIPLPYGSRLFTIPDTPPVAWDSRTERFITVEKAPGVRGAVQAVSAFMAPGYVRTLLPACDYGKSRCICRSGHTLQSAGTSNGTVSLWRQRRWILIRTGIRPTMMTAPWSPWCGSA